jgi:hypothetical protein
MTLDIIIIGLLLFNLIWQACHTSEHKRIDKELVVLEVLQRLALESLAKRAGELSSIDYLCTKSYNMLVDLTREKAEKGE